MRGSGLDVTSMKSWREHWKCLTPAALAAPPEAPLPPQGLMTHRLSLEPSNPLHTLDRHQQGFSKATRDSWNVIPFTATVLRTVVHSGKNFPVVFSLIGSVLRKGEICKPFDGTAPSGTCSLSSWRKAAACPQSTPSPAQEPKGLTVPQVLWTQKVPSEAAEKTPA